MCKNVKYANGCNYVNYCIITYVIKYTTKQSLVRVLIYNNIHSINTKNIYVIKTNLDNIHNTLLISLI